MCLSSISVHLPYICPFFNFFFHLPPLSLNVVSGLPLVPSNHPHITLKRQKKEVTSFAQIECFHTHARHAKHVSLARGVGVFGPYRWRCVSGPEQIRNGTPSSVCARWIGFLHREHVPKLFRWFACIQALAARWVHNARIRTLPESGTLACYVHGRRFSDCRCRSLPRK